MPKQKENMVGTVVKAAAIIDAVARRGSASATDIAEDLGEPRSSVYRILKSLKELGYVDPGSSRGSFRLGLKLVRLGGQSRARLNIRDVSLPVMERIHDDTEETVYLCLRAGNEAMCIERLDGHRVTSLALQVGGTLPLHVGAGPRALLAFSPRKFWHQYAAEVRLKEPDGRSAPPPDTLMDELELIRNDGYSISDGDVTKGIAALGAPIFDSSGKVAGSLSLSGARPSILGDELEQSSQSMLLGAHEISHGLGYSNFGSRADRGDFSA